MTAIETPAAVSVHTPAPSALAVLMTVLGQRLDRRLGIDSAGQYPKRRRPGIGSGGGSLGGA